MLTRRKPLTRRTPLRPHRRPRPTGHVDEALLARFRCKRFCEWCGRKLRYRPQVHHIHSRGAGRVDVACNLLTLGGPWDCSCHHLAHCGKIRRQELLAVAARREGMTVDEAQAVVWEVRRVEGVRDLHQPAVRPQAGVPSQCVDGFRGVHGDHSPG